MASKLGPPQRRFAQQNSPSTVNLLSPPSSSTSPGVQAAFAQPPRTLRGVASDASLNASRYGSEKHGSVPHSISDKFSLSPDPSLWGADLSLNHQESDDFLHNPDPRRDRMNDQDGNIFTYRGIVNLGCVIILLHKPSTFGGFNIGGMNASGQVPSMPGNFGLVDTDTPKEALYKSDYINNKKWQLVFSDEFNVDGRSFWPGDDPYWEALDLHYWQTNNMEWVDPTAITTSNGSLKITMSAKKNHNLNYTSGMMTTWNKFCFTGGLIEVSVVIPGFNNVVGFWPAIWTMGNLGRAGYGASLEGMWPYTYDYCDVGTMPNQTNAGLPLAATENGDSNNGNALSYLPGQRLSRCSCPGSSHPGPMHEDGTFVGRAAPEIDVLEAQITGDPLIGQVSQSGQWAPFNHEYLWDNTSDTYSIKNTSSTYLNSYLGAAYQQATSAVTDSNQNAYERNGGEFAVYGYQYQPGFDGAYIGWIANGELVWVLQQPAMAADPIVEINQRPVPQEPMYVIVNLGMSNNFFPVDLENLPFPATMSIDYIRVYQDPSNINIGCDPKDFPTAAYINEYMEAYTNPNLTTWRGDYGQPFPNNSFAGPCP
ncbi:glycoside hydrolase family 16 protein [Sparassis latifolia]